MNPVARASAASVTALIMTLTVAAASWPAGPGGGGTAAAQSGTELVVAADGSAEYSSIADAIAAAQDGDTIAVLPGVYDGPLEILADITLEGRGARDEIVVAGPAADARGDERGSRFIDEGGSTAPTGVITLRGADANISGLTVQDGTRRDGSIVVIGGAPTLTDVSAGSVLMRAATDAAIDASTVRGTIRVDGGTASITDSEVGQVDLQAVAVTLVAGNELGSIRVDGFGSTVRDNTVQPDGRQRIGIEVSAGSSDVTIAGNSVTGGGAGLLVRGLGPVRLRGNRVTASTAGLVLGNPRVVIEDNTFCDNTRDVVPIGGVEVDLDGNRVCEPASVPSIDPALVPDADGFVFEEVEPGVRRLVSDGAGHYPSAPHVLQARDMDELGLTEDGSVMVWSTTHGVDNELAGDQQLWILGQAGVQPLSRRPARETAAELWRAGQVAATEAGFGQIRQRDRLGSGADGTLWAMLATEAGRQPARFDGSTWTVIPQSPGTSPERLRSGRVAPDGSLWAQTPRGGGVTRFDGHATESFLGGHQVNSFVITPDGRVWVATEHRGGAGSIFVLDHEQAGSRQVQVGDPELASRFPSTLGRTSLEVRTMTGTEWLRTFDRGDQDGSVLRRLLTVFVSAAGRSIDDLTVGFAVHEPSPGNHATVTGVRLRDADAERVVDAVVALLLPDIIEPELMPREISGKLVTRVADARTPGRYPRYAYAADDVVWIVEAEEPTLSEIFAELP